MVNARRLELLPTDLATALHGGGVLVIDDSGDERTNEARACWPASTGCKIYNGVVTVTTLHYPLDALP